MQGKNTAIQVQDALVRAANKAQPVQLEVVLQMTANELGFGVNTEWAVSALESRGFIVEDLADRRVVRKPGICIDPKP